MMLHVLAYAFLWLVAVGGLTVVLVYFSLPQGGLRWEFEIPLDEPEPASRHRPAHVDVLGVGREWSDVHADHWRAHLPNARHVHHVATHAELVRRLSHDRNLSAHVVVVTAAMSATRPVRVRDWLDRHGTPVTFEQRGQWVTPTARDQAFVHARQPPLAMPVFTRVEWARELLAEYPDPDCWWYVYPNYVLARKWSRRSARVGVQRAAAGSWTSALATRLFVWDAQIAATETSAGGM